jgi:hypothetical protein
MKRHSDKNLTVIQNFILHLTHSGEHGMDDGYKKMITLTPEIMYRVAKEYIKEDHVDGQDNPDDEIVEYGAESSFVTEDRDKEHPEYIAVVADFGEQGTKTCATIDGIENLDAVNDLLDFIKDPQL